MQVKIDITESRGNRLVYSNIVDMKTEIESHSGARRIAREYRHLLKKGQYLWVYFLESDRLFQFTPSQLR